jgi:PAS domain S-box-containing protein
MSPARESRALLDTVLDGIGQPFYIVDGQWRITFYNRHCADHLGWTEDMIGRRVWDLYPQDRDAERGLILQKAMASRAVMDGEALSLSGRYVAYRIFPVDDGIGVFFRDVTDRREAEARRDEALAEVRRRTGELEAVLQTVPTAVWFTYEGAPGGVTGNWRAAELLRLPHDGEISTAALARLRPEVRILRKGTPVGPDDFPVERAMRGEELRDELYEIEFAPGDRRILLVRGTPLRGPDGALHGAVCAAADVTERHRYEDHLRLLVDELNHRVKNTLAIVQGIASLTLANVAPAIRADFERRLLALSAVHDLLTRARWEGVKLGALVQALLAAHADAARERIRFTGDDLTLAPKPAVALSLALNELATNALKYGALSSPAGRVALAATVSGNRLQLRWQEDGGPPVAPPTHVGFGTRILQQGLARELGGEVKLDYRPQGLVCTIDADLARTRAAS